MAYHLDSYDNALVIDGFENGIGDSPHSGLSDMRNVNIISVPGEGSVNFSTSAISYSAITTGTITSVNSGTETITFTGATGIESGMAIVFSGTVPSGIVVGTTYWVGLTSGTTFQVYSDFGSFNLVNITSTTTGATFASINVSQPKYFTYANLNSSYWMVDSTGKVWTNSFTTTSGKWIYTGNDVSTANKGTTNGNGLVYYQTTPPAGTTTIGYVFNFRNSFIDYIPVTGSPPVWVYGWNPADGTTGNTTAGSPNGYLKTPTGTSNPHEAQLMPTNQVVFCDANWVGRFYEKNPGSVSPGPFSPTNTATYIYDSTQLLPGTDIAQCLTYLGTNILVGGQGNVVYPWNGVATTFNYPILLAEYNVKKLVTVNTNTYIFVGNRGRIYVTNGTNANLFKKIPDHISGTVEPYFTWGGATSIKNQLYFSFLATTNALAAISQYGGLWAIDLDTKAIRLTNKLSYATYAGYATALIPNFSSQAAGTGLYIGWDNASSGYGIDTTISTPYTGSQATIDSDLIPIGTFNKPRDLTQIEYKLTRPLVAGESVVIKTRLIFNTSDTGYTTTLTDSSAGNFSNTSSINFSNAQWVQFQIVLNSTASSPSYTRLRQIRIMGLVKALAS